MPSTSSTRSGTTRRPPSSATAAPLAHLRDIAAELQIATVRAQVMFYLDRDFEDYTTFTPGPDHEGNVNTMLDQLIPWAQSLETVRVGGTSRGTVGLSSI